MFFRFDPSVKTSSIDTASLVGSDISDNSLQLKRMKQAEAARQRYQRLTPEERKEINAKRTLAQKRKRQRDKEVQMIFVYLYLENCYGKKIQICF